MKSATALISDDSLVVDTSRMRRKWKWTSRGFVTVSLQDKVSGVEWCGRKPAYSCDWSLWGIVGEAELLSVDAKVSDDEGFTSEHIEVRALVEYPREKLQVEYLIWAYPSSPGIRTQIRVKSLEGFSPEKFNGESRVEYIPVSFENTVRREIGYYNDTQHRNEPETEILREEVKTSPLSGIEEHSWGSILCIEKEGYGLAIIKESHKCVNQPGVNCGVFRCDSSKGVESTGSGLSPEEIVSSRFRGCWASWCLVYSGGDDGRELALKVFDRLRYPIKPNRDIYIIANTWGSGGGREAAREENVLKEIESQADLGIDVQQIDDGWQDENWRPRKDFYPEGWTRVAAKAKEKGVKLGLWFNTGVMSPKELLENLKYHYNTGGFLYFKLDGLHFETYSEVDEVMKAVREFIKYTGHKAQVNWDVTENSPRVGYFFAKEYGCIYLENRKPESYNVYIPYLVLRDLWQLSKYINLNKVQCTVQNIDRVDPKASDAHLYSHQYCVAITLMGTPIFFQETHLYSQAAREQIKSILKVYKKHRKNIFKGYVFPIGSKPDNKSWTGFQCHIFEEKAGYLLIFRELHNHEDTKAIQLKFISNTPLKLKDLLHETETVVKVAGDGKVVFKIEKPADFRFYQYKVLGN